MKTIKAIEVREGQTVTGITCFYRSRWLKRPVGEDQRIRRRRGQWPTVTDADYLEDGEGGQPTVYLTLSDAAGYSFCLNPSDEVTVEVAISVLWSPDVGAYAAGEIGITQIECALCETAPCDCPEFGSSEYFALLDRRHGRSR